MDCYIRDGFADCPVSHYVESEKGHGRVEERRYCQMTAPSQLHGRSAWERLKTIGAAVRVYEENGPGNGLRRKDRSLRWVHQMGVLTVGFGVGR